MIPTHHCWAATVLYPYSKQNGDDVTDDEQEAKRVWTLTRTGLAFRNGLLPPCPPIPSVPPTSTSTPSQQAVQNPPTPI